MPLKAEFNATNRLFVYGTLKSNKWNNHILEGAKFIGKARTLDAYPMVVDGLPYLLDAQGQGLNVIGECYAIYQQAMWTRLDMLEGHPNWYRRQVIDITVANRGITAWAYFLLNPDPRLLKLECQAEF